MKFSTRLKGHLKLLRLILHLFSGLFTALLFLRQGIHQQPRAEKLFVNWNRKLCNLFHAQISCHGKMQDEATLYVMNHISWFDIPVLASQQPLHFLSKSEVARWPLIGWLTRRSGTLFIERGVHGAAQKSIEEIVHCLQQGGSVVIFPEGTTTDGSSVKRFHSRLFQAAIDAGVKVQPIALRYPYHNGINPYVPYIEQMTFMQSVLGLMHSKTLQVELNFLPAIDAHLPGKSDESPAPCSNKHLALLAQQAIAQQLESNMESNSTL